MVFGQYNTIQYNAMQCNEMQYNTVLQYYCRLYAAFTLKTTSETATRAAWSSCSFEAIPLHLISLNFFKKTFDTSGIEA